MPRLGLFGLALMTTAAVFHPVETYAEEIAQAAQTSRHNGVTITVMPPKFSAAATSLDFAITLESHVQSLDDDLTTTSMLLADGKPLPLLDWVGAPPGGHHRKGVLRFKVVTPLPQSVELQVHRTGEANPRIFRWQLN